MKGRTMREPNQQQKVCCNVSCYFSNCRQMAAGWALPTALHTPAKCHLLNCSEDCHCSSWRNGQLRRPNLQKPNGQNVRPKDDKLQPNGDVWRTEFIALAGSVHTLFYCKLLQGLSSEVNGAAAWSCGHCVGYSHVFTEFE